MRAAVIALAAGSLLGALAGWVAQGWRADSAMAHVQQQHAETLRDISEKSAAVAAAVRKAVNKSNAAIAAADTKFIGELANAKAETQRYRDCVRAGTCGVRIVTKTVRDDGGHVSSDTSATGVGNDAQPLDAGVSERVFDLRDAISEDSAKLGALQAYAEQCWRAGTEAQAVVP